ncbi:MAG: GNAT family N-acetyltransferase [Oscillospiraceae bacterium]|nr:GNAT family N-acetyltransferase [Oscillospiraceae bacterium]
MNLPEFREAGLHDIPKLVDLWIQAFGENDRAFSERFYKIIWKPGMTLAAFYGAEPVSMAQFVPVIIKLGKREHRASYMYACATAREFRGGGLFSGLYAFASEKLRTEGIEAIITIPQSPPLFGFYSRFGFKTAFDTEYTVISEDEFSSRQGKPRGFVRLSDKFTNISPIDSRIILLLYEEYTSAAKRSYASVIFSPEAYALTLDSKTAYSFSFSFGEQLLLAEKIHDGIKLTSASDSAFPKGTGLAVLRKPCAMAAVISRDSGLDIKDITDCGGTLNYLLN